MDMHDSPKISLVEPPAGLLAKSLYRVRWEDRRRKARLRLAFWGMSLVTAVAGLAASALFAQTEAESSGFIALLRLAFTDLSLLWMSGTGYGMSLLESIPAIELGLTLLLAYFASICFCRLFRAMREVRHASWHLKAD